jgi:hypothetical protein
LAASYASLDADSRPRSIVGMGSGISVPARFLPSGRNMLG